MQIGLITVRDKEYHPNQRLAEAAAARGHSVMLIHPYRIWPGFLGLGNTGLIGEKTFTSPHVVLPRQGADVGPSCLPLIRQFELMKIPVVNNFEAVRISRHQFYTLQVLQSAGIGFPETVFVNSEEGFYRAVDELGGYPLVVKHVSQRQGAGVVMVSSLSEASRFIFDHLAGSQKKRQGVLVQRYLPAEGRLDIRVLVIGGHMVGAQTLTPVSGDFRSNAHLGGQGRLFTLTDDIKQLSLQAAAAVGLEIAGVDIMVAQGGPPLVGEVNYSPGFRALEKTTGDDIAGKMIDFALKKANEGGRLL